MQIFGRSDNETALLAVTKAGIFGQRNKRYIEVVCRQITMCHTRVDTVGPPWNLERTSEAKGPEAHGCKKQRFKSSGSERKRRARSDEPEWSRTTTDVDCAESFRVIGILKGQDVRRHFS